MTWDGKIPCNERGELFSYSSGSPSGGWRDNPPFNDTLTFTGYGRGRSSALLYFVGSDGRRWPVFLSDAEEMIPYMVHGKLLGNFVVKKRGANFGLAMHKVKS